MINIRALKKDEWTEAMALAWKTFLKFEGDVYDDEGVTNFYRFVTSPELEKMFDAGEYKAFGAFDGGTIVGIAGLRNTTFLSLLFVDEAYHHRGIGTALIAQAVYSLQKEMVTGEMTVNSSPYAVGFYHHVGFEDTGKQTKRDGIITTPMKLVF